MYRKFKESFHEPFEREEVIHPSSDRQFCMVIGCICLLVAAYGLWRASASGWWYMAAGILLMGIGLVRPSLAAPLNRIWLHFGLLLARVTNPIILFLLYVVAFVPIGFILRIIQHDPLARRYNVAADSYWILRMPPGPQPDGMEQQF